MVVLRNSRDYAPADVERFIAEGYWNDETLSTQLRVKGASVIKAAVKLRCYIM